MSSAQLLQFLVNDLIDLFRIRNGKFSKNESLADIRENLIELIAVFSLQAQEKGLKINFQCDEKIPQFITIDIQRIKQILINLIGNALKFTFQGSISLKLGIAYNSEGFSQLLIIVKDTGIGIKAEDRSKIFQLLGKLESSASINTSGVGLGLSTCKKIIEALEGTI